MPLFRTKPTEVEAFQFDGTSECASRLKEKWPHSVRPITDRDGVFEGYLMVGTVAGELRCMAGDWVGHENGAMWCWNAREFDRNFERNVFGLMALEQDVKLLRTALRSMRAIAFEEADTKEGLRLVISQLERSARDALFDTASHGLSSLEYGEKLELEGMVGTA